MLSSPDPFSDLSFDEQRTSASEAAGTRRREELQSVAAHQAATAWASTRGRGILRQAAAKARAEGLVGDHGTWMDAPRGSLLVGSANFVDSDSYFGPKEGYFLARHGWFGWHVSYDTHMRCRISLTKLAVALVTAGQRFDAASADQQLVEGLRSALGSAMERQLRRDR